MGLRQKIGQVWVSFNEYSNRWEFIEDADGHVYQEIKGWKLGRSLDRSNPYISLALISDIENALEWAIDCNRELAHEEIENDEVQTTDDWHRELNYQYHLTR